MRALVAGLVLLFALPAAASADAAPWRSAARVTDGLFHAQTELVLGGSASADVARARRAYTGSFRATLRAADPAADRAIVAGLRDAARAVRSGDEVALAAARGTVRAGLYRGAHAVTLSSDAAT
ncbi:MAG TPA: hypothetical protein VFZ00_07125, partial [Solirubrobacter sp.]|nr:hypothetical protein [Solirubrobacter sp.]